ncbi:hypothetical protein SAMN02745126_04986 [Enhydrobacter aerosaccus]|uniref:DUF222 domain-containing protein n=1 Tax=Enhydrobacter aerosaccus TaxID=225324 RepID=A0A1T4SQM1_9HYPH|nr:hypothetical protein [Enhydrobacter aerosaccus]SKA30564.1 hypothetical protein SAMN02745126_04986 [Enhydrobacter aerosaccus]
MHEPAARPAGSPSVRRNKSARGDRRRSAEGTSRSIDGRTAIVLQARAGDRIDPAERVLLDPLIAAAREHLAGQDYLKGLAPPDTHDPDALDAAYQAAATQNESDWPDNPSQRATNQHFIDVTFGTKKREALKARADLAHAVTDWLAQPAADGGPQTRRPPLPIWTRLTDDERQTVDDRSVVAPAVRSPLRLSLVPSSTAWSR